MTSVREKASAGILPCSIVLATLAATAPFVAFGQTKPTVTVVNPVSSPVNARITNPVVPVEVRNADPIPVTDSLGPGRSPTRFGPVQFDHFGSISIVGPVVVPTVSAGRIFVVTSLHATLFSNIPDPLSDARCDVQLRSGSITQTIMLIPTEGSVHGTFFGNLELSLPLSAGESLMVNCYGTPTDRSQTGRLTATGYYVLAP